MDDKDEKVDLSALSPGLTPERYERMVKSVSARGIAALQQQSSLPAQLSRWARPVLAVSAVVLLAAAFGLLRPSPQQPAQTLEQSLLGWSATDHVPTGAELYSVLGGGQ
jgi:hypothetical protein